jgi:hypothetical protein
VCASTDIEVQEEADARPGGTMEQLGPANPRSRTEGPIRIARVLVAGPRAVKREHRAAVVSSLEDASRIPRGASGC